MTRRELMMMMGALPMMSHAAAQQPPTPAAFRRVRPGEPGWPSEAEWEGLKAKVGGRLIKLGSPLDVCRAAPTGPECSALFRTLKNPWAIGDDPALTQTTGWREAWASTPSAYAVAAAGAADVAAAVEFARRHRLRLVVKGGGHSYQGTSCAPDSLLVWTRKMDRIELHDSFVAQGCGGVGQPAVSLGAGVVWLHAYAAVTKAGRYVQGGGCMTVGVAGLIQSGGFGSFSKRYGLAAASLIEAEVVTADGQVRIANACIHPDLFWALKGGGGGSFGVVTRLTLATHELPAFFGAAYATVKATSDGAFRRLVERFMGFYREALFNPHWGEQARFHPGNVLELQMVFQGLDQAEAQATWRPFFDWIGAQGADYTLVMAPFIVGLPARSFWDARFLKENAPDAIVKDDRPDAPENNMFWRGNLDEAGFFLHAYESTWMPAALLEPQRLPELVEALFAASRRWTTALHFNKGLAGAPPEAVAQAKAAATNPAAADAFALALIASAGAPAFAGIAGHEPDLAAARQRAERVAAAMKELRKLVPDPGSYVSESNYFEADWQKAFWGPNYARLRAVKDKYDPEGLFFVHHGVGSEDFSPDGFARLR
jgi:FAD/FMN-containing dehydrogenase